MVLERIDPPGNLDDLDEAQRTQWSDRLSSDIDSNIDRYNLRQFYNPTKVETAGDAQSKTIDWTAFPKNVTLNTPSDRARWRTADSSRSF